MLAAQSGISMVLDSGVGLLTASAESIWRRCSENTAVLMEDVALRRLPSMGLEEVGWGWIQPALGRGVAGQGSGRKCLLHAAEGSRRAMKAFHLREAAEGCETKMLSALCLPEFHYRAEECVLPEPGWHVMLQEAKLVQQLVLLGLKEEESSGTATTATEQVCDLGSSCRVEMVGESTSATCPQACGTAATQQRRGSAPAADMHKQLLLVPGSGRRGSLSRRLVVSACRWRPQLPGWTAGLMSGRPGRRRSAPCTTPSRHWHWARTWLWCSRWSGLPTGSISSRLAAMAAVGRQWHTEQCWRVCLLGGFHGCQRRQRQ